VVVFSFCPLASCWSFCSPLSVTAAAHLSPLVDYADLDGNLLISNDPFHGVRVEKGKLILPKTPGLGLTAAK
jgi:L-alanine-DL-glutamate epimerase-like enolase superfamily enzyme